MGYDEADEASMKYFADSTSGGPPASNLSRRCGIREILSVRQFVDDLNIPKLIPK